MTRARRSSPPDDLRHEHPEDHAPTRSNRFSRKILGGLGALAATPKWRSPKRCVLNAHPAAGRRLGGNSAWPLKGALAARDPRTLEGALAALCVVGNRGTRSLQMPRRKDLESVLIIGSGPIVIGQACEFDYS